MHIIIRVRSSVSYCLPSRRLDITISTFKYTHFLYSRIVTYFEEISQKLAREQDLTDPLIVDTEGLTFRGQTVSCAKLIIGQFHSYKYTCS